MHFWTLLGRNANYRRLWLGQLVSEIGDHFNSISVLSLSLHMTGSGAAVGGVMMARTFPAILAGPIAGVVLDRMDRRLVMVASDLIRAVIALLFILILTHQQVWLLYVLSALLMFCSPFFTAGRSAILPSLTSAEELHTANALTQTTAWLTLSIGTMLGGASTAQFGYKWAFVVNAASFLVSAWAVWGLESRTGSFRATRHQEREGWHEFVDGLRLLRTTPLLLAIALCGIGWASGGGAAQILFTLFGELVFQRGPAGVGIIWGFAGVGLVIGGLVGHRVGAHLRFAEYKRAIAICFFLIGGGYMLFSIMENFWLAVACITVSRIGMGVNNVLNRSMLLHHVPDAYRGRIFSTVDTLMNAAMMLSMSGAAVAAGHFSVRVIGFAAGALTGVTAIFWTWANLAGKLPPPALPEPASAEILPQGRP